MQIIYNCSRKKQIMGVRKEILKRERQNKLKDRAQNMKILASTESCCGVITTHESYTKASNFRPEEHQLPDSCNFHDFLFLSPPDQMVNIT